MIYAAYAARRTPHARTGRVRMAPLRWHSCGVRVLRCQQHQSTRHRSRPQQLLLHLRRNLTSPQQCKLEELSSAH